LAVEYLSSGVDRADSLQKSCLRDADVVLAICSDLASEVNSRPSFVAQEAELIHKALATSDARVGLFDDRDYLEGESALLVGAAYRLLGKRDVAEIWFDKAEAGFRHTINPVPSLARVSFERIAQHYDLRRYERVLESIPSLMKTFEALEMKRYSLKTRLMEALALKDLDRTDDALLRLGGIREDLSEGDDVALYGIVVANQAQLLAASGRGSEAIAILQGALANESLSSQPLVLAQLKVSTAEYLRVQNKLGGAAELLRGAIRDYLGMEMQAYAAYLRVLLAETLIALSRNREAEWEILAALPTIESERMVPEGFAALSLLQESVRRRSADVGALREVKEHLQTRP
jgi:tetratricopeptide (TPR) repeat protein